MRKLDIIRALVALGQLEEDFSQDGAPQDLLLLLGATRGLISTVSNIRLDAKSSTTPRNLYGKKYSEPSVDEHNEYTSIKKLLARAREKKE